MEECTGQGLGKEHSASVISECITLPESPWVRQPGSSPNPVLLSFYRGFITQAQLIKLVATDD